MDTKVCKKCGIEKPLDDFSRDKKMKDGRFGACKECEKVRRAKYDAENADKLKLYRRVYYEIHKEEISEYNKKYYQKNHDYHIQRKRRYNKEKSEELSERKRKYYAENREQELARCKRWAQENPEKARQKVMKREAIKKGATVGNVDYTEILNKYGMICHICGNEIQEGDLHFDHVIPLSRGGKHSMDNIKPAHASCNLHKFNKII